MFLKNYIIGKFNIVSVIWIDVVVKHIGILIQSCGVQISPANEILDFQF